MRWMGEKGWDEYGRRDLELGLGGKGVCRGEAEEGDRSPGRERKGTEGETGHRDG